MLYLFTVIESEANYFGKEFILGFGENVGNGILRDLELYITTSAETPVTVNVTALLTSDPFQQVNLTVFIMSLVFAIL